MRVREDSKLRGAYFAVRRRNFRENRKERSNQVKEAD